MVNMVKQPPYIAANLGEKMSTWIYPKAFWIATALILVVQIQKLIISGFSIVNVVQALTIAFFGGVFWGAIGTFIYKKMHSNR